MRINANKKIHKMKLDSYHLLLRITAITAIVAVVSAGVFLLCNAGVQSDYRSKRDAVAQLNEQGEQEFNARMNALRAENAASSSTAATPNGEVSSQYWEVTLDDKPWRIEDDTYTALENTSTVTVDRADAMIGGLLLVNPWHALPADFTEDQLVSIGNDSGWKIAVTDGNTRVFPMAFAALQSMIDDAATAGLADYMVREAYRTNDTQTQLFEAQMTKLSTKYSGDILVEQAKKTVNYPGTSEYQTGQSFRMDIYNKDDPSVGKQKFQASEQGKWFTNNSWKYGVVFRFPTADFPNSDWEDKSYKTGMSMQLNLYRYVGKAHAAAMKVLGYCLEEYVEFLIDHPHICIYEDGALRYEVYRIAADDTASVYEAPVPNPASSYEASLDNMGGLVMTYIYQ